MAVALLALATRLPAIADGVMLVSASAFWMGRDDGPPEERRCIASTCAISGSSGTR